jgi:co-chaperonin GroES (HSP10)
MNITVGGRYMIDGKNVKNNQNAVVSNIGFVPGRGQVAYLPVKEAARRKSGIFVPGAESKTLRIARVVAVGEPTEDDDTSPFTVGDIVAYSGMTSTCSRLPATCWAMCWRSRSLRTLRTASPRNLWT